MHPPLGSGTEVFDTFMIILRSNPGISSDFSASHVPQPAQHCQLETGKLSAGGGTLPCDTMTIVVCLTNV